MNAWNFKYLGLVVWLPAMWGCEGVIVDRPHRRPPPVVVYRQPPPAVVYQPAPPPAVVYQPAPPTVYQQTPPPAVVYQQPPPGVAYTQPPPVVQAPPGAVYEEGAVYNGVVIVEPASVSDYVLIGGNWYYYHPGLRVWVHARRPGDWRPPESIHVYHSWAEHPQYRGRR